MVSMSTIEIKYIVLRYVIKEVMWIRCFINKILLKIAHKIIVYENNKMSITFTKNIESQNCTKHSDIQHYYIRKLIEEKNLIALSGLVVPRC